jgi:hypothetical protein
MSYHSYQLEHKCHTAARSRLSRMLFQYVDWVAREDYLRLSLAERKLRTLLIDLSWSYSWKSARMEWTAHAVHASDAKLELACGCAWPTGETVQLTHSANRNYMRLDMKCFQSTGIPLLRPEADPRYKDCAMPPPRIHSTSSVLTGGVTNPIRKRTCKTIVPPKHYPTLSQFTQRAPRFASGHTKHSHHIECHTSRG